MSQRKDELKINVSFKQTEKGLYDLIKEQRSPSNFIKDAVDYFIKNFGRVTLLEEEEKEKPSQQEMTKNSSEFFDI